MDFSENASQLLPEPTDDTPRVTLSFTAKETVQPPY